MSVAISPRKPASRNPVAWPPQVDMILSALETGQHAGADLRALPRRPYRVEAKLRLFSDAPNIAPWILYTRDATARGIGSITPHRLPLGYGGTVEVPVDGTRTVQIHCTLHRCRQAAPGWYEGALYFNREQDVFEL